MIVALLGAECTGKSTLAAQLAASLEAALVPEYLRTWCLQHQRTPAQHEQAAIAAAQAAQIAEAARTHPHVICDTTPLMTAVFSQHYFADDSLLAPALAKHRQCALTLLCAPDLPWQADGFLRDGPAVREAIDQRLRHVLRAAQLPWVDIAGTPTERLATALTAIQAVQSAH
ncbi:AAA family ATPase [Roseateles sp. BYS87W]|uniref:AAA family ATPase n=1 Tax=Pelomonas baiyunensis TaxID=3299026 RepID=A0ABW7GXN0_9BURK